MFTQHIIIVKTNGVGICIPYVAFQNIFSVRIEITIPFQSYDLTLKDGISVFHLTPKQLRFITSTTNVKLHIFLILRF